MKFGLIAILLLTVACSPFVQETRTFASMQISLQPDEIVTYKTIGDYELTLHVFFPAGHNRSLDKRPAFVAIHGGGWKSGTPRRFYPYASAMSEQGYVGISVQYRLINHPQGSTVFDSVKDGRSAVRWIRKHSNFFGIDPDLIAVSGGSAGAHIAAGTAIFDGIDHQVEDTTVSSQPNALVLLYPVIDTSAQGYGQKFIGKDWETISPVHQVKEGMPPTIIFHGDADEITPYAGAVLFVQRMKEAGNTCIFVPHKGGEHGHINKDMKLFDDAINKTAAFLEAQMINK